MINSKVHRYSDGHDTFVGRLVWNEEGNFPKPGVLVVPAFGGLGDFEVDRAHELAAAGYVVLAVDYYGDGKNGFQ